MKLPASKSLLINAGVVLTIGFAAIVFVRDLVIGKVEPICTARYTKSAALPLDRAGQLIKPEDIQSAAFGQDHGVMTNLTVRRLKEGPAPAAMGVKLDAGSAQPTHPSDPQGGVSFPWRPRGVPPAMAAACLTYHVFLPADFDFDYGGTLPGMFGTSTADAKTVDRLDLRFAWGQQGSVHQFMLSETKDAKSTFTTPGNPHHAGFPLGRWVRIDQEVILNTASAGNGIARLWIDEELRAEIRNANFREDPLVAIQGVMVDAHFGGTPVEGKFQGGKAKKKEQIWISPPELRWN